MNSTDNLDVFNPAVMAIEADLPFTSKSTNNDLDDDQFVQDYLSFSNDHQCQCDDSSPLDPTFYDLRIDFSHNFKDFDELVIMVNLTVPNDLPVTKAQQGHIYCYDTNNDIGFIVGNTFPVEGTNYQSNWVKNDYIFLKNENFDPDNFDEREDTFYRFGLTEDNGIEEIWYQI